MYPEHKGEGRRGAQERHQGCCLHFQRKEGELTRRRSGSDRTARCGEEKLRGGRRRRDEGERGLLRFCHLEYLWD